MEPKTPEEQARESLAKSGFTNPDALEIQGAIEDRAEVLTVNTEDAVDSVNNARRRQEQLQGVPIDPTQDQLENRQRDAQPEAPDPEKPQEPQTAKPKTETTFTLDEAMEVFGTDFTGLHKDPETGEFVADETALKRAGITGLDTSQSQAQQEAAKAQSELEAARAELKNAQDNLKNLNVSNDPALQQMLSGISAQWDGRIREMEDVNRRRARSFETLGIRIGARFTGGVKGGVFGGVIAEEERQGIQRVSQLEASKQSALTKAEQAYREDKWDEYVDLIDLAQANYENQLKEVEALNKATTEHNQAIAEQNRRLTVEAGVSDLIASGVTDANEIFRELVSSGISATSEEVQESLSNLLPPAKTKTDLGVDGRLFEMAKEQGWLPENASIFDYWQKEAEAKKSPTAAKVGHGTATQSDYEQFSREQVALSVIPTQLKNSEAEMKRLLVGIRQGLAQGVSAYDVADNLMGYIIEDKSAFSDGMRRYISVADLSSNQISEVARLINAGEQEKAISVVENEIYKKIRSQEGDRFVSEADVTYVKGKVDDVRGLLGEGFFDEVGAFTGSFSKFISTKFGRGEAQKIKSKITNLTADLVNKRAGSAMTDEEWKRLVADSVPQMNDSANAFAQKLDELIGDSMSRLNAERSQFELPTIDEQALVDRSRRVSAYSSETFDDPLGAFDADSTTTNDNPLGLSL